MFGLPLSLRTYAEIFGALILIVFITWFIHHEREIGAAKVVAADQRAVAAEQALETEKRNEAQHIVDASVAVYRNTVAAAPPADALHVRMCKPSSGVAAGKDGSPASGSNGPTGVPTEVASGSDAGPDIGPATEKLLIEADAQITLLQGYVKACQAKGFCDASPAVSVNGANLVRDPAVLTGTDLPATADADHLVPADPAPVLEAGVGDQAHAVTDGVRP